MYHGGQLPDPPPLLTYNKHLQSVNPQNPNHKNENESREIQSFITQNVLSSGSSNDNLSTHRGDPNLNARVSILGKLSGQNLVKLGEENSVSDELYNNKDKNDIQIKWEEKELLG